MIKYLSIVKIIDSPFYKDIVAKVLDQRANSGGEYLLDLNPPRWIPKRKVIKFDSEASRE
jgi:hypothetical protein